MQQVTLILEPSVALFYTRIAKNAGVPLEKVLSDALFKLAGELSLEAIHKKASPGGSCHEAQSAFRD
jgi:hypothetical protein